MYVRGNLLNSLIGIGIYSYGKIELRKGIFTEKILNWKGHEQGIYDSTTSCVAFANPNILNK